MGEQEVWSNPDKMRKLGRRQAQLGTIVNAYRTWLNIRNDLDAAQEMAGEDPDFAQEAKRLESELPEAEEKLRTALIPRDPDDARDVIMEIKPARAARRRRCSPAICCACTCGTRRSAAGV